MAKKSSKKAVKKQQEEELQPEVWDIRHAYGSKQSNTPKCMGDGCSELAVACWFSSLTPDESWNCCEKCQVDDFGGWPPNFVRNENLENVDEETSGDTNTTTGDEVINESKEANKTNESTETLNDQLLASEPQRPDQDNDFSDNSKKIDHDKPTKNGDQNNKDGNEDIDNKPVHDNADEKEGSNINDKADQAGEILALKDQDDIIIEKKEENDNASVSGTEDVMMEDVLTDGKNESSEVSTTLSKKQKRSSKDEELPEITQEEVPEVTQEEEEEEEWTLTKLFSVKDLKAKRALRCNTENCELLACVTYMSSLGTKWNTCLDCQYLDYGGWPPENEMPKECFSITEEHKAILTKLCSIGENPKMPPSKELLGEKHDSSEEDSNTPSKKQKIEKEVNAEEEEEEEEEDEFWTLTKLFSIEELRLKDALKCNTEGCNLFSCVTYTSSTDGSKWNCCLDCQQEDYGGWPEINEMPKECFSMTDEHKEVLIALCSTEGNPKMPETIIDETKDLKVDSIVKTSNPSLTPPPKSSKENNIKNKQPSIITPPPIKQPSHQALKLHQKWQEAAESLGGKGARIIVAKDAAKKIIFDMLKDSFTPMNITDVYKSLKAIVPSPVLKTCLDDMTDDDIGNPFDDDSDDEDTSKKNKAASKKKNIVSDSFASSLMLKAGRGSNTALYYVDYNKLANNGNGLLPDERDELITASQSSSIEEQNLKKELQKNEDLTKKLISEPTNEEASIELESKESEMAILEDKLDSLRVYNVNEHTRKKVIKRIDELTSIWRKRRRICKDFLIALEECTDGTISMKKCLAGDGQIYAEDDNYAIREARIAAKAKARNKLGGKRTIKLLSKNVSKIENNKSQMNHTETFVGVKLDNSGNISRVHLDDEDHY